MPSPPPVTLTPEGLYCPPGDFYIDPWQGVPRAVITHAHGDHARLGSNQYLTAESGNDLLRLRLGPTAHIEGVPFGSQITLNDAHISFHPAGHILGSAQIRIEHRGQICVVSGDYKTTPDATTQAFESLPCHHFVSECTFGLPIFRWPSETTVFEQIHDWWRTEQERGRTCILLAYSLGKAQRVLAGLDSAIGPILGHGAVMRLLPAYEAQGVKFPPIAYAGLEQAKATRGRALVLAPPSASGSSWIKKFGPVSVAMASGWMRIRGLRRRKALDRGFVLSDHADWPGLNEAITASGAELIWLTHGSTLPMQRWLTEKGHNVQSIATQFHGEADEPDAGLESAEEDEFATPPTSSEAP